MDLNAYLSRIGFEGDRTPTQETLARLQHLHLLAIPYENIDVFLGRPVTISPADAFEKLITRARGGWCYEMNGLLGWALGEMGFSVTRLAGAVMRARLGDAVIGNHLVLRVDLSEGPVLADVGLGDGPAAPFALQEGVFEAAGLSYRLERLADGWWRLHNAGDANPPSFDFHADHVDEARLEASCDWLRTAPESTFVQTLICQRLLKDGHAWLIGRILRRRTAGVTAERLLASADDLAGVLADDFGLAECEATALWSKICARERLMAEGGAGTAEGP